MEKLEWWHRFEAAIEEAIKQPGVSYRSISLDAGMGENRVSQILGKGPILPGPSADAVRRICGAINVSLTYIYTGADLTPDAENFLATWAQMTPAQRALLMQVAENIRPADGHIEEDGADFPEVAEQK